MSSGISSLHARISGSLSYGTRALTVDLELDVRPLTMLIGPNLTGKSLVLQALAEHRGFKPRIDVPSGLSVHVEPAFEGEVLFIDSFRVVEQLYDVIADDLKGLLNGLRDLREAVRGNEELEAKVNYIIDNLNNIIRSRLRRVLTSLLDAKGKIDDYAMEEALKILGNVKEEVIGKAREAGLRNFEHAFPVYVFPVYVPVEQKEQYTYSWRDLEFNTHDEGVGRLSTGFAASLVVTGLVYAYALNKPAMVLIEEPEVHAHPTQAFFLGYLTRRFVSEAIKRGIDFYVVVSTHSFDYVNGAFEDADWVKVYILNRKTEDDAIRLFVEGEWHGEGVIPGFTEPSLWRIVKR